MSAAPEIVIRLLFVDDGSYHTEEIRVREDLLERYERLIDLLQEEPTVLKRIHIDFGRLCSATVADS